MTSPLDPSKFIHELLVAEMLTVEDEPVFRIRSSRPERDDEVALRLCSCDDNGCKSTWEFTRANIEAAVVKEAHVELDDAKGTPVNLVVLKTHPVDLRKKHIFATAVAKGAGKGSKPSGCRGTD